MAELGEHSAAGHEEVGRLVRELGIDEVLLVGADSGGLSALRATAGGRHAADVAEALRLLAAEVRPGDVVLVKASRSVGLERVGLGLLAETGQGGAP
jgi:UDP-N-acetylmuramoyl-tripeptide--D-alanyl-D-alanine ligase